VVTNKPFALSRELLDRLDLLTDCRILLGGDSLPVKKPHPAPLLHCCMTLSLAGSECLYVGDHERDIQAGKAAGMDTAVALWGYIEKHHDPVDWRADYLLRDPSGLLSLINEKLDARAVAGR
jgi:phosphoglycolate phosphatase